MCAHSFLHLPKQVTKKPSVIHIGISSEPQKIKNPKDVSLNLHSQPSIPTVFPYNLQTYNIPTLLTLFIMRDTLHPLCLIHPVNYNTLRSKHFRQCLIPAPHATVINITLDIPVLQQSQTRAICFLESFQSFAKLFIVYEMFRSMNVDVKIGQDV